jgi:Domain of unknown function (DUF5615)
MARLLADEDVAFQVVARLRELGHNVVTLLDLGRANEGVDDRVVLDLAKTDDRTVVTMNRKHFMRLHREDSDHSGIIVCTVDVDFTGLAERIDAAIESAPTLRGELLRVYRPATRDGA